MEGQLYLLKFFMNKQLHLLQARLGFVVFCFVLFFSFLSLFSFLSFFLSFLCVGEHAHKVALCRSFQSL